ncbi:MAG: TIGR02996 domain-containing protein [Deltaproteobacteria bacterium]
MSTPAEIALERALGATTPEEMLPHLLDAWREYEAPAIADLIDVATARALAGRAPIEEAATLDARQQQWLELAAAADPANVPWLIERTFTTRIALTVARLNALWKLPRDPRIASGLLALTSRAGLLARSSLWTRLLRIVRNQNDLRSIATIEARLAQFAAATVAKTESESALASKLAQTRLMLAARILVPPAPRDELFTKLGARLADPDAARAVTVAKTAEDFYAEIWAKPNDDGPREVFADWLIEQGDPRGELIALQIARARGTAGPDGIKRERKLLAEHARTWLGALSPVVKNVVFERGFLGRAEIMWRRLAERPELMTHPAWATVREYKLAADGERSCDRWLDHMIALGAKRV